MTVLVELTLLIALLALALYAGWGESRTIARCLAAVRSPQPLNRLGAEFLLTEVAVIALLGLAHGAYPLRTHAVTEAAWLPLGIYFAGWMLRDIGLWQGPAGRGRLRWAVVIGAAVQALAAVAALAAVVIGADWPSAAEPRHAGTPAVTVAAVTALVAVTALRLAWGRRGFTTGWFAWFGARPPQGSGHPATPVQRW
jgi:hypothetical protein